LNAPSDGSDVIAGGSAFQTFATATGTAGILPGHQRCNFVIMKILMMWNSLPEQLRQQDITFGQFKRSLNVWLAYLLTTVLFCLSLM